MKRIKLWLMGRYCPGLLFKVPFDDDDNIYRVEVIIVHGYWGHKHTRIMSEKVRGRKNAYYRVRWLALLADWRYPSWAYNFGIDYHMSKL